MPQRNGKNLVKGTLVLITGNIIVKILGALFKLPLANIIGADGMGLYNSSFIVFDIFLVLSTAGFPLAISKMVSKASAMGNDNEALKIFTVSRNLFIIIGISCTVIMLAGSKLFSELIGNTRSYNSMLALAPAILFVSVMSAYRGYYQGTNDMIPTTISQIVEAVCRLVIGLSLSWYLKQAGYGIEIVAVGAIIGITIGEFSATFSLGVIHHFKVKKTKIHTKCNTSSITIIKTMFATSIPIGISTLIISVINMLDNAVVMRRLQFIGHTEKEANILYGCFNMAFTVFSLPITIVAALTISVFPVLSYAFACKDYRRVSKAASASLRMAMLASTAAAAMFLSLSYPIVQLLYFKQPQDAAVAAPLLMMMGPSAISISLTILTTCILQSVDKLLIPSRSMIIGGIACLMLNWFLVGNKALGIYAAPIGIFVCYTLTAILNILAIRKTGHIKISYKNLFYKPLLPAVVMAFTGIITFQATISSLGLLKASAVSILFCIINYTLVLFLNKSIDKQDLLMLPKGDVIISTLEKMRLLPKSNRKI
jgi:stage V sporulation protein B